MRPCLGEFVCPQRGSWEREVPAGQTMCPGVAAAALGACTALPTAPTRARVRDGTGMPVPCGTSCVHVWSHAFHACPCGNTPSHGNIASLAAGQPRGHGPSLTPQEKDLAGRSHGCGTRAWPAPRVPCVGQGHCPPTISPMGTRCQPGRSPGQQGWGGVCTNVWFIKAFLRHWHLGSGCTERPLRGRGQRGHMQLHETQYKRYKRVKTGIVVQCVKINNWGLSDPSPKQGACVWPFLWHAG